MVGSRRIRPKRIHAASVALASCCKQGLLSQVMSSSRASELDSRASSASPAMTRNRVCANRWFLTSFESFAARAAEMESSCRKGNTTDVGRSSLDTARPSPDCARASRGSRAARAENIRQACHAHAAVARCDIALQSLSDAFSFCFSRRKQTRYGPTLAQPHRFVHAWW